MPRNRSKSRDRELGDPSSLQLPPWIYGGSFPDFLEAAGLVASAHGSIKARVPRVCHLIVAREIDVQAPAAWQNITAEDTAADLPSSTRGPQLEAGLGDPPMEYPDHLGWLLSRAWACDSEVLGERLQDIHTYLTETRIQETGESLQPSLRLYRITHTRALLHRLTIPRVAARIDLDPKLRAEDADHIRGLSQQGELVFQASSRLTEGAHILDSYLGPLLTLTAPWVWSLPVTRSSGTYIFVLSRPLSGKGPRRTPLDWVTPVGRSEPPHSDKPYLDPIDSPSHAITAWTRMLERFFGVLSDPATFSNAEGLYSWSRQIQSHATVERLFTLCHHIQASPPIPELRLPLLFNFMDICSDTLGEMFGGRKLKDLLKLSVVDWHLQQVEKALPHDARRLMLHSAIRGRNALEQIQTGFYLNGGRPTIDLPDRSGDAMTTVSCEEAAAEYLVMLRHSTHGFGTIKEDDKARFRYLTGSHNGYVPPDVALIASVYLLFILSRAPKLSAALRNGKRSI